MGAGRADTASSNYHVMKLMFCRIYDLIPMWLHTLTHFFLSSRFFLNNKGNRTICKGSLILFSLDFCLLFDSPSLEVEQEAVTRPFHKLWFMGG